MSPNPHPELPRAKIKKQSRFSLIWIVPVLAAAAAAWLVFISVRQMGPVITITFVDGSGLQANQTILKYHGVRVGEVISVELAKDLKQVIVHARLQRSAAALASEGSQFWIVRPEVSTGGLHGLETIVSGPYIEIKPAESPGGKVLKRFTGVETAPPNEGRNGKYEVILASSEINTLSVGSSVYYRGIEVGAVSYFALSQDSRVVNIHLLIQTNFAPLIRADTKFWNAGGISVRLKLLGINVSAENFKSLIIGGIAFATPTDPGPPAPSGTLFELYTKVDPAWQNWSPVIPIPTVSASNNNDTPSVLLNDVNPPESDGHH